MFPRPIVASKGFADSTKKLKYLKKPNIERFDTRLSMSHAFPLLPFDLDFSMLIAAKKSTTTETQMSDKKR